MAIFLAATVVANMYELVELRRKYVTYFTYVALLCCYTNVNNEFLEKRNNSWFDSAAYYTVSLYEWERRMHLRVMFEHANNFALQIDAWL